jgi:hypothetical protein
LRLISLCANLRENNAASVLENHSLRAIETAEILLRVSRSREAMRVATYENDKAIKVVVVNE